MEAIRNTKVDGVQKMGLEISAFGETTCLVKGYPEILGEKFDLDSLRNEIGDIILEEGTTTQKFEHRWAASVACRSAVKAGDKLTVPECQHLVDELFKIEAPFTCPHGRPTFIKLEYAELERKFKRT